MFYEYLIAIFVISKLFHIVLARKRKIKAMAPPEPGILEKRRKALRRTHRQVIYLNDSEMKAVNEYCRRYGLKGRSAIFREATLERILEGLDESHPTLF